MGIPGGKVEDNENPADALVRESWAWLAAVSGSYMEIYDETNTWCILF
jgi:hypothetical protein